MNELDIPKVSVCMITYNHAPFVRAALDSILSQKTDFNFNVVIGDDASTDGTIEIIEEYKRSHPKLIEVLDHSHNHGMSQNFFRTFHKCTGHFIAFCEGDDYWTDDNKLQLQVNEMELRPDCSVSYHQTKILYSNNELKEDYLWAKYQESTATIMDLLVMGNMMQTCSVMIKNTEESKYPARFADVASDYLVWLWYAQFGAILRLPQTMGVYRSGVGLHSTLDSGNQRTWTLRVLEQARTMLQKPNQVRAIELRIAEYRYYQLPETIRNKPSIPQIYSSQKMREYASLKNLLAALIKKIGPAR